MGKNYGALIERYAGLVKFSQDLLESHRVRDGVIRQIDRILRDGITTEEQRGDAIVKLVTVLLQFYDDPKSIPEIPNVRLLRALQTAEQSATNDEASSAEPT
jgi:hypothetical protein